MKQTIVAALALSLAAGVFGTAGMAAKPKPMKKMDKASVTLKCPSCNMQMPTQATKMFPVPVKAKGQTFYCCVECKSGKAAMRAMKHMKPVKSAKPAKKAAM